MVGKLNISSRIWIAILCAPLILLQGCFEYEDIDFLGVQDVAIADRTDSNLKLKVAVKVDNPNSFNIKVKKSTLDIYLNDKYVGKTTLDEKIVLKKKTVGVYDVFLNTDPRSIMKAAMGSFGGLLGGEVTIRLKGKVKGSVYGISKSVDVDMKEKVDLKSLMQ